MARALSRFSIEPDSDGYLLSLEDDDGTTTELVATAEQLDLISEAIDEHLEMADIEDESFADEEDGDDDE